MVPVVAHACQVDLASLLNLRHHIHALQPLHDVRVFPGLESPDIALEGREVAGVEANQVWKSTDVREREAVSRVCYEAVLLAALCCGLRLVTT